MLERFKQSAKLICLVLFILTLSACWDNKDINHRVLPVILGISKKSNNYMVYLQIPQPYQDTMKTKVVIGEGKTITHAIDNISTNMESSVDLLHLKVIVIDRELAEKGMKDIISGFVRSRDVSPKTLVAISEDDIGTFFSKMKESSEPGGTALLDYFEKSAGWTPQIALTSVWKTYRSFHTTTQDVAIPILRVGKTTLIEINGAAVIKNGKMIDQITPDETLLFNAFNDESTTGKVEITDDGSVLILTNTMKHDSKFRNHRPYLESKINLKVSILEIKDHVSANSIRKDMEKVLTERFNKMFTKLQENESDILGLGQFFRNKLSRNELNHWRTKYYPNLTLDFKVHVVVQNGGNLVTQ
ncbi:spore gernimation protein GerC [Bacillus sp. AFS017336]|nr:spore gernimation protein GerC [Bacillus sp. AFS017336]